MTLKNWVQITNSIDEYDIYNDYSFYRETKNLMLERLGDDEIDEIFIEAYEDGAWVVAKIYLK